MIGLKNRPCQVSFYIQYYIDPDQRYIQKNKKIITTKLEIKNLIIFSLSNSQNSTQKLHKHANMVEKTLFTFQTLTTIVCADADTYCGAHDGQNLSDQRWV